MLFAISSLKRKAQDNSQNFCDALDFRDWPKYLISEADQNTKAQFSHNLCGWLMLPEIGQFQKFTLLN